VLACIRDIVGWSHEQTPADGYRELFKILKQKHGIDVMSAAVNWIDFVGRNAGRTGWAGDIFPDFAHGGVPTKAQLYELLETNPNDPRAAAVVTMARADGGTLFLKSSLMGYVPIGGLSTIDRTRLGREDLVPYGGNPYDPGTQPMTGFSDIMGQIPTDYHLYTQGGSADIVNGFSDAFDAGLSHQLLSWKPWENAFWYQLVWGPLGLLMGRVATYLLLCMRIPDEWHVAGLNEDAPGGYFWWAFDDCDGHEDPWWFLPCHSLIKAPEKAFGEYPGAFAWENPLITPAMHEVWYDEIYKWTWVVALSFLVWATDYMDLAQDGLGVITGGLDFGIELLNCFLGGVQVGFAEVFQTSCYLAEGWNDTLQLDCNWLPTDTEPPYFWLDLNASYINPANPLEGTDADGTIAVVPSYLIPLESAASVCRHMLCFSVPDLQGRRFPEWEPTLGVWFLSAGIWWLRDGQPLAYVWEFRWWADLLAAGALITWLSAGQTYTFAEAIGGVLASTIACTVAAAVINRAMSDLSHLLVLEIMAGLPTWQRISSFKDPKTAGHGYIGGGRYHYTSPC
jgi:hypothetical protein